LHPDYIEAVLKWLLGTGCQWKALPHGLGALSTVHDRFQISTGVLLVVGR